jgi:hypothetical protein
MTGRPQYPMRPVVFSINGVPRARRECIEAALVEAAGTRLARIDHGSPPTRSMNGFRVLITVPHGFERTVTFGIDDDPAVIAERGREAVEG